MKRKNSTEIPQPTKRRKIGDESSDDSQSSQDGNFVEGDYQSQDSAYVASDSQSSQDSQSSSQSSSQAAWQDSWDKFHGYLRAWLGNNAARVDGAYDSGSGWEGWLQVELLLHVKQQPDAGDIEREPHVYPGSHALDRADFVFEGVTIEIKAETEQESPGHFATRVNDDTSKLENLHDDEPAVAIGVCLTRESYAALEGVVENRGQITNGGVTVYYGFTASV